MDFLKFLVWLFVQVLYAVAWLLAEAALLLSDLATDIYSLINERGRD